MPPIALLPLLIKEIGRPVAEKIWSVISGKDYSTQLQKASVLVANGLPVMKALQEVFGKTFSQIINDSIGSGPSPFTFEAGTGDYIRLNFDGKSKKEIISLLRDELNINLERVAKLHKNGENDTLSYFKGVYSVWKKRFTNEFKSNLNEIKSFDAIDKLLDGGRKTVKDLFVVLKAAIGVFGALLIINAVLIAMGAGVGIIAQISLLINGIPGAQAATFVISGATLMFFALLRLKDNDVMTACVSIAYRLLDERDRF